MTWRFWIYLLIYIVFHDFTTLFYVILRCQSSKWLELCIESALGMQFTIWSLDLAIQVIKRSILLTYFRYSGKHNFYVCDPWSSVFTICEPCPPSFPIPSQYVVSQVTRNFCLHYIILFLNYIDNLIENQNVTAFSLASDKAGTGTCKFALTLFYAIATIHKLTAWLH